MTHAPCFCLLWALSCGGCGASTNLLGDGESGVPVASDGATKVADGSAGSPTSLGASGGRASSAVGGQLSPPVSPEQLDAATAVCGATSWIFSGLVPNSRSLGGVPLPSGSVTCGRIYRGSQLANLGADGCGDFAALGIKSVIDLRTAAEAALTPSPECTFKQAQYVSAPMPIPYNLSPANYIADLHTNASVLAAFAVLGEVASYPVLFHCTYGRDRSGVLAALILRLLGASREVVMAEYMRTQQSGFGSAPMSLQATLDEIERLGGAEAFLLSIGVPAKAIAVLRAQSVTPVVP